MGAIILLICVSIALAFLSGALAMIMSDSYAYNESSVLWFTLTVFGLLLQVRVDKMFTCECVNVKGFELYGRAKELLN